MVRPNSTTGLRLTALLNALRTFKALGQLNASRQPCSSRSRRTPRALAIWALTGLMGLAIIHAGPARADEQVSIGIVDVGAWQSNEGTESTIWVDGSLDPAPTKGRVAIDIEIPGVGRFGSQARPDKDGTFSWSVTLPPEASGTARIRVAVKDAYVGSEAVAFPSLTMRIDIAPWVPVLSLTDTGGDPTQYRFIHVDDQGRPAQWDPCRPLIYQVETSQMPGDYLPFVHEAMARLGQATGLEFMYGGEASRALVNDPRRLPDSTILIGWSDPAQTPVLDGSALAVADLMPTRMSDGRLRVAKGWVILDGTENLAPGFITTKSLGQVLLHELGHVMNLDHVLEPVQLMYPYLGPYSPATFQQGDLAGLAWARSTGCMT